MTAQRFERTDPAHRLRLARLSGVAGLLAALAGVPSLLAAAPDSAQPLAHRRTELIRMVRQDCGSCHGMRLTGGLGPALTREALADRPLESIVATIVHGRPGTPMPGWLSMMSEADADWIARRLLEGFPEEGRVTAP